MPHPPLSDEDKQFLRAILANPAELTAWLAYADWLDEHDDRPRADFVRLQARLAAAGITPDEHADMLARLDELSEHCVTADPEPVEHFRTVARLDALRIVLDPDWVAVFDRPRIENCDGVFAFKCPKKWEQLTGTDDPSVRHCATCDEEVHYCRSVEQARGHAISGHCVAIATGVKRFPGDLSPAARGTSAALPPPAAGHVLMGRMLRTAPPEPEPPKRPWWKFW